MSQLDAWGDAFLTYFPTILAVDTARYVIAATVMAALLPAGRRWLARRRLQERQASRADRLREIAASLRTCVVFALAGFLVHQGATAGVLRVYLDLPAAGIPYLAASLAGILLVHDAYFYWTHRLLHRAEVFRWAHRLHHLSRTPTPFAAYAFDTAEAMVQAAFLPLFLLAVPMHPAALFAFVTVMILRNVMGHAGVELHPRGMADHRWFGWLTTTTHHDLHHRHGRCNYGLYFTWWDRWMGTEHPGYRAAFRTATEAAS